jgi:predicted dienelactone hydrolase
MRPVLIAALFALFAAPALAQKGDLTTDQGLSYHAWLPRDFASHHHDVPLILFSHGFGGCAQQSRTLTQALADHGYAVLAPNHKDHACERHTTGMLGGMWSMMTGHGPDVSFGDDEKWNATTEVSRRDDMQALLAYALSHAPYREGVDPAHIALMGHSLGGYTVLGLAGAWDSWRDPRFKAVLALAPFATPYLDQHRLGEISIPVMFQGGSDDRLVRLQTVKASFTEARAPKYLVVLKGAGHFSFTELNRDYQKTIAAYAVAFFDRELLHKPAPLLDEPAAGQVADYRHD